MDWYWIIIHCWVRIGDALMLLKIWCKHCGNSMLRKRNGHEFNCDYCGSKIKPNYFFIDY